MTKYYSVLLLLLLALVRPSFSQVHYVPAQILIPTFNGTPLATVNHTIPRYPAQPVYNQPQPSYNHPQPPYNQPSYQYNSPVAQIPPAQVGWNHWNPQPSYNYTKPGVNSPSYGYNYNSVNYRYNNSNNSRDYNSSQDGHLWVGTIQPFDRLLFNQEYFKTSRWWGSREKIVEYPKDLPAGYNRHETITAIRCYNKFYDGNTARAEIVDGGIGRQYVKIKIYSKWGNGFRYLVQIFGH
ncbi:unnamed protein product [Acanthoscelides obtectus]|uniref:Uncharacterized protein n=1 Tax=Acanthoscelides obtectus TaxID=200917 RepID=A0A9P0Q3P1_ACAOB|nr:unnamed protein product [Acanthoscelides obtectus]CAK1666775.1 hypothetical protein AOBTE_LOCUS25485 [Acanthoscelides obtectus]